MTFLSPDRLWLLVLPAFLAAAYVVAQRARRRHAVRFTNLDLLASIAPKRPGWRRHLSAAALLIALVLLSLGFARPAIDERVPREQATVILALDVSLSMAADDVDPNRLDAAQRAAREFASSLPQPLRLGLVAFSGSAQLRVPPTTDRRLVIRSIDQLTLGPRTAIGEAVFTALDAIDAGRLAGDEEVPAHVIVMSDGTTTSGRPDAAAAAAAEEAGVPVTTIAYGTDRGVVEVEGQTVPVPVDREALEAIATETGGRFFEAADSGQLEQVYDDIGSAVGYETETREVTAWFTGLALLAATAAAVGSLLWMGRLP